MLGILKLKGRCFSGSQDWTGSMVNFSLINWRLIKKSNAEFINAGVGLKRLRGHNLKFIFSSSAALMQITVKEF